MLLLVLALRVVFVCMLGWYSILIDESRVCVCITCTQLVGWFMLCLAMKIALFTALVG